MASKKSQQPDRELRRLALAERWEDVKALLMARLDKNPQDSAAKAELERLINGRPLRITLSAAQRLAADADDAENQLADFFESHPAATLKNLSKQQLSRHLERVTRLAHPIHQARRPYSPQHQAYLAELKSRLRKFTSTRLRKWTRRATCAVLCIALATGAYLYLRQRAERAAAQLSAALEQKNLVSLKQAKNEADTQLNRFFCPQIEQALAQAREWENDIAQEFNHLNQIISELEAGKRNYATLTPQELQLLDTRVHRLRIGKDDLLPKWQQLYKKETQRLQTLKNQLIDELHNSMPQLPALCADADADEAAISHYLKQLRTQETQALKLIDQYQADSGLLTPIRAARAHALRLRADIRLTRQHLHSLQALARYEDYYQAWQQFCPQTYAPALALAETKKTLPPPQEIRYHMQAPGKHYAPQLLQATEACFVHGKSSFTEAYPATQEQINIPQDLFSAPSYQHRIFILTKKDGTTWYSTIEPKITDNHFVTFTRSSIDPNFTPEHNQTEFELNNSIKLNYSDSTHLLPGLRIDKHNFFLQANLPQLLTDTLNFPPGDHPALAQAYIYQCLLRLAAQHPHKLLSGVEFSPTLRQHAASFKALLQKHDIELTPGCWLSRTEWMLRAERDFAAWFRKNKGHDYRAEMAKNFLATFRVQAQYCGFVCPGGHTTLCRPIAEGSTLWYVTPGGLSSTQNHALPGALPYSPIFIEKRTTPQP